jgi:hypothetical protein
MKLIVALSFLFLMSFSVSSDKLKLDIEGNPQCLVSGKEYKMKITFTDGASYDNLIISGKGIHIIKNYKEGNYTIKASDILEKISIILAYKDEQTQKVQELNTFVLDVCSDNNSKE